MRLEHFVVAAFRRRAEVYVRVPLRHAQRDAVVEFVFAHGLRRGVHHANQLVAALALLFVEQRRGMFGIEAEDRFEAVLVVGEVIHLLRQVGQEDLEAVGERGAIVAIFFRGVARAFEYRPVIFMCGPLSRWWASMAEALCSIAWPESEGGAVGPC